MLDSLRIKIHYVCGTRDRSVATGVCVRDAHVQTAKYVVNLISIELSGQREVCNCYRSTKAILIQLQTIPVPLRIFRTITK